MSAVYGENMSNGVGTYGSSNGGRGVVGDGGTGRGVVGYGNLGGDPPSGTGVAGYGSSYGVYSIGGIYGIYGYGNSYGVSGYGNSYGVMGTSDYVGVYGYGNYSYGVMGISNNIGVYGYGYYDFYGGGGEYARAGSWSNVSDRNAKENFIEVDGEEVLEKVNQLPITQWNFKKDKIKAKHIGPVGQDFYALFGLGDDDKHTSTGDTSGIALVGIKALNQKVKAQESEIKALKVEIESLKKAFAKP
jgi:hypothetical protein